MLLLFYFAFIVLCGHFSLQIAAVGAILSVLLYGFAHRFLGYRIRREWQVLKKLPFLFAYIGVLIYEILLANLTVMRMILSPRFHPSPLLVTFSAPLHSNYAKALLANSITLTPGTITVRLEGSTYTVHCLDESLAAGLEDSIFVRMLQRLEA